MLARNNLFACRSLWFYLMWYLLIWHCAFIFFNILYSLSVCTFFGHYRFKRQCMNHACLAVQVWGTPWYGAMCRHLLNIGLSGPSPTKTLCVVLFLCWHTTTFVINSYLEYYYCLNKQQHGWFTWQTSQGNDFVNAKSQRKRETSAHRVTIALKVTKAKI